MAILNFTPNRSIIAGGRKVRITGNNTFFGSSGHTYDVKFCYGNNGICVQCRYCIFHLFCNDSNNVNVFDNAYSCRYMVIIDLC